MKQQIHLKVNGKDEELLAESSWTLAYVLREQLNLTGLKIGCDEGNCGACTVLLDGEPVYSCLLLAVEAEGKEILTVEGLSQGAELHSIQQAFIDHGAIQCGYCTPGMVMTAKGLLDTNPDPTVEEIKEAMAGNLCRCTGYKKIIEAVRVASKFSEEE